jgi:hypothetical protein
MTLEQYMAELKENKAKADAMCAERGLDLKVANPQSCEGRDGLAWSGDLILNGEKIGTANNSGNGGCTNINVYGEDRKHLPELQKIANEAFGDFESLEEYIGALWDDAVNS